MAAEFIEPEFEENYAIMLNAVGEYLDSMHDKNKTIDERDIRIIKALIDFYDYDPDDILDILDDVVAYSEQLERREQENERH